MKRIIGMLLFVFATLGFTNSADAQGYYKRKVIKHRRPVAVYVTPPPRGNAYGYRRHNRVYRNNQYNRPYSRPYVERRRTVIYR
ncbi:MAG: hypothetical protein V4649_06040 [Bacteroidota bacterium]